MSGRVWIMIAATSIFVAIAEFVAALIGPVYALAAAFILGASTVPLLQFLDASPRSWWAAPMATTVAMLIGIAGAAPAQRGPWYAAAPLVGGLAALATAAVRNAAGRRCRLCNEPLRGALSFECPRCGLRVCETRCWSFEGCRCRLCKQNGVPLLSSAEAWWRENVGPRVTRGRCQLCKDANDAADLRACPQCGRPQCRKCWDDSNGACTACHWLVRDLPARIREYTAPGHVASRHH